MSIPQKPGRPKKDNGPLFPPKHDLDIPQYWRLAPLIKFPTKGALNVAVKELDRQGALQDHSKEDEGGSNDKFG